jgi:hypothetical protein
MNSILDPDPDNKPDARANCPSAYNAGRGLWLHCTGEHLRGNIFRGEAHQQRYAGVIWTWYDDEADTTREGASR